MDDDSAGIVAVDVGVVGALNAKRICWIDGLQLIRFGVGSWWDDVDELNYCDGSLRLRARKSLFLKTWKKFKVESWDFRSLNFQFAKSQLDYFLETTTLIF